MSRPRGSSGLAPAALLTLLKITISAVVLASGFRAVSDDDFARVVIAEEWAHTPRWDASGTSWLPFPFWITGAVMMALGRGLFAARAAAFVLGVVAALLVYLAARWLGEGRRAALLGAAVAAIFPWSARLGVATVPELFTAALTLIAIAAIASQPGARTPTRLLAGAAAITLASLSRYEAWPIALVFAALAALDAARSRRGSAAIAALIALVGSALWLVHNRLAHGDALHFLARVAAYRKALGGAEDSAAARLWAYPQAMLREEPELFALLATAVILLAWREGRAGLGAALGRYARPAAIVAAQIAALSLAMIKDGAPTHHPERAVLAALLLAAIVAGALAARVLAGERRILGAIALAAVAIAASLAIRPRAPRETFAARGDEEAAGRAAATLARPGEPVLIEVADYGYLAVIAALGRPEDAVRDRSVDPRDAKRGSSFTDATAIEARVTSAGARWVVARVGDPARAALGEPIVRRGAWGVFRP